VIVMSRVAMNAAVELSKIVSDCDVMCSYECSSGIVGDCE